MAVQAARARAVDIAAIGFVDDRPPDPTSSPGSNGSPHRTSKASFTPEECAAQKAKILAG
jgi:hypothetical protein